MGCTWRVQRRLASVQFALLFIPFTLAQFLDGIRVKWLGEPVIVEAQEKEAPIVPTLIDTSEPQADYGIDRFMSGSKP